jgi:hypothetical protein
MAYRFFSRKRTPSIWCAIPADVLRKLPQAQCQHDCFELGVRGHSLTDVLSNHHPEYGAILQVVILRELEQLMVEDVEDLLLGELDVLEK